MQQALTNKGYNTQGTDGKFGNNTLSAVKAFQKVRYLHLISFYLHDNAFQQYMFTDFFEKGIKELTNKNIYVTMSASQLTPVRYTPLST